ncbi:MAG: hypothetical protein KGI08_10950, partial [Thaumarchaeota archaeon]|nr:hypothetical protein [Nitrososphaerota archaeon]
ICADYIMNPDRTYQYTTLTSATVGGDVTVYVGDTSQFPTSGTVQIGTDGSTNLFTYTGKTSTSFTGCSGVLAAASGTQVATTGRSRAKQLWNSRTGKKVINFTDIDGTTYQVWFTECAEDSFVLNQDNQSVESEMSVSFVQL